MAGWAISVDLFEIVFHRWNIETDNETFHRWNILTTRCGVEYINACYVNVFNEQ